MRDDGDVGGHSDCMMDNGDGDVGGHSDSMMDDGDGDGDLGRHSDCLMNAQEHGRDRAEQQRQWVTPGGLWTREGQTAGNVVCIMEMGSCVCHLLLGPPQTKEARYMLHGKSRRWVAHQISCPWKYLVWKGAVIGPGIGGKRSRQAWAGPDPPGQDGVRGRIYNDGAFRAWRLA